MVQHVWNSAEHDLGSTLGEEHDLLVLVLYGASRGVRSHAAAVHLLDFGCWQGVYRIRDGGGFAVVL